ncbi:MAG: DEAD/DEAH box helicase [Actinomycetales bacterium]|nr:DEAD/DEAH box helicase [Actinomycetales bacterium]
MTSAVPPAVPPAVPTPAAPDAPPRAPRDLADLVPEPLLGTVLDLGFVRPTPVQERAIPPLMAGRDLVGVAQTGTGKTAAFGLPLLARLTDRRAVQALVLVPTRELALQVADALAGFARGLDVAVTAVYGGAPFLPQKRALDAGAQVVVGTPGRVLDHLDRGTLRLADVGLVVLDEADEMLRMGFAEDVDRILSATPPHRQVALFSATMPPAIAAVAARHLRAPVRVEVARQSTTAAGVRQTFAVVPHRHKLEALVRVLATDDADAALVFTRTRAGAEETGAALVARGIPAATLSGDVAQKDRERIVERLRSGALDVVVATDVAARGLDVDRIGLVVNLDVPTEPESYVHRVGRTGRAGRSGRALTFVTPAERHRLRAIERATRVALEEVAVPTGEQVAAHRVARVLAGLPASHDLARRAVAEHCAATGTDPAELAAALLAAAAGEVPADLPAEPAHTAPARTGRRYRVAVGRTHGVRPEHIVGAITNEGGLRGADLGRIDIRSTFSLVEIGRDLTPEAVRRIGGARVAGRPLRIAPDRGPRGRREVGPR